jgi:DNA-binding response OmpR family regulator
MPRILVVEDAASTLDGLCELLQDAGYDAVGAASLEEGTRLAKEAAPDLLLVDVRLGRYDGLRLALLQRSAHPDRQLIVTTAFPDSGLEAEARRCGAEFLAKPIQPASLLAMIRRLLPES